jgi:hypothetical protein
VVSGFRPRAALRLLLAVPFEVLRRFWDSKIVCARESLLDFDDAVGRFKDELTGLFTPLQQHAGGPELAYFPPELRTPIMEAGKSRRLLRLIYQGRERLVEPYELAYKRRADGIAPGVPLCLGPLRRSQRYARHPVAAEHGHQQPGDHRHLVRSEVRDRARRGGRVRCAQYLRGDPVLGGADVVGSQYPQ